MGTVKCQSIVNILEEFASRKLAESWDNVGLLVGEGSQPVNRVMVCLDLPEWVVDEAISKKVDMIIAHHPIIFSNLKRVNSESVLGRKLMKLIRNNISVYCTHTNYDIAVNGLNDRLVAMLGFSKSEIIETTSVEKQYKLVVYVPAGYEERIMDAFGNAGAGRSGKYSHCTYRSEGIGTFMPLEGSDPFIGKINKLEGVKELKVETIATDKNLNKIIREMLKVHPYEEAAYDIIPLENEGKKQGLGRLVELETEMTLEDLARKVKTALGLEHIKVAGNKAKLIKKAAILNGAGNKFVNSAYFAGAQVLITGDMQYHEIVDAVEMGMSIIDAGHYATEKIMIQAMTDLLKEKFTKLKYEIEVVESASNLDPVTTI